MIQSDEEILALVDPDAFWDSVKDGPPDQCWPWTGFTDKQGYGIVVVHVNGAVRWFKANRVAYLLANDDTLGPLLVCHHCDNPPCCNPRCLFKGTDEDNRWDRVIKNNERRILDNTRKQIQHRHLLGDSERQLMAQFGVTALYVRMLIKGMAQSKAAQTDGSSARSALARMESVGAPKSVIGFDALLHAFFRHKGHERIPSRVIANESDGLASAHLLACALRREASQHNWPCPRSRPARSPLSDGRNVQHYVWEDVEPVAVAIQRGSYSAGRALLQDRSALLQALGR